LFFNNAIYFIADDGTNGSDYGKGDGTGSGTIMVKNGNLYSSGLII
jgi:ELWxxDGT repeat protein